MVSMFVFPTADDALSPEPRFGVAVPSTGYYEDEHSRMWIPDVLMSKRNKNQEIRIVGVPQTGTPEFYSTVQQESDDFICQGGVVHYEGIRSCDHYEGDPWKSKLFLNSLRKVSRTRKITALNSWDISDTPLQRRVVWENHDVEMCWVVENYPDDAMATKTRSWNNLMKNFRNRKLRKDEQLSFPVPKEILQFRERRADVVVTAATESSQPVMMLWNVTAIPDLVESFTRQGYRIEGVVWKMAQPVNTH